MERFGADLAAVIARASAAGVKRMLVPGLDAATSQQAVELAGRYDDVYCAVGFHPTEAHSLGRGRAAALMELSSTDKVVAIGEIGLDYYWVTDAGERRLQCAALQRQLDLARAGDLPVVLHLREQDDAEQGSAARDLLAILRDWTSDLAFRSSALVGRSGVLHSFSGSPDIAAQAIELGFHIGVTGPITYPNADRRRAVVESLPLDRLLTETDSPFLSPQQHRGKRNEPAFIVNIADRIAAIQSRTPSQVAEATTRNAARLFGWGEPD